jgi:hypothetical protein
MNPNTVRLFVGADCNNCDLESQMVLEYTARKYCSAELEITWMQNQKLGPWGGWRTDSGRTPFTHYRWSLPAVTNYEGKAIYTDSDFIFCADLADLWAQDVPSVMLLNSTKGKLNTSCILFNCENAKGIVPDLPTLKSLPNAHDSMLTFFREHKEYIGVFDGNWNSVDNYIPGHDAIKAVHYSRIETQCHALKYAVPRLKKEGRQHWYTKGFGPRQIPVESVEGFYPHRIPAVQALFDQEYQAALDACYTVDQYRVTGFDGKRRTFSYSHHAGARV